MTDVLTEIADLASELCDGRPHTEKIYKWSPSRNRILDRVHTTEQPGLLEQLRESIYPAGGADDEQAVKAAAASKPPLLLEALSRHIEITMRVNDWLWENEQTKSGSIEAGIRKLVGIASVLDPAVRRALRSDMRRWRGWAAVLCGWDTPPYCPHVPCPQDDCGKVSLRLLLEKRVGMCSSCGATWGPDAEAPFTSLTAYIEVAGRQPKTRVAVGSTMIGHGGWQMRVGAHSVDG